METRSQNTKAVYDVIQNVIFAMNNNLTYLLNQFSWYGRSRKHENRSTWKIPLTSNMRNAWKQERKRDQNRLEKKWPKNELQLDKTVIIYY